MNSLQPAGFHTDVYGLYHTVGSLKDPELEAALNCGFGFTVKDCIAEIETVLQSKDARYASSFAKRIDRLIKIVCSSRRGTLAYSQILDSCNALRSLFPSD